MSIFDEHILPWEVNDKGETVSYDVHCDSCTYGEWAETREALEAKLTKLGWSVEGKEVWCAGCQVNATT